MSDKIRRADRVIGSIAITGDLSDCPPIPYGAFAGGMVIVETNPDGNTGLTWGVKHDAESDWCGVIDSDGTLLVTTTSNEALTAFPIPDQLFGAKFIGMRVTGDPITVRVMLKG